MLRKMMIALLAASFTLTAAACNTVHGAGEDLESASDAVKNGT